MGTVNLESFESKFFPVSSGLNGFSSSVTALGMMSFFLPFF